MTAKTFGQLRIDPAKNPAVLDTATWEEAAVRDRIQAAGPEWGNLLADSLAGGRDCPPHSDIAVYSGSAGRQGSSDFVMLGFSDSQYAFAEAAGQRASGLFSSPLATLSLTGGRQLLVYPATAANADCYVRSIQPDKGPRALGSEPRIGIGTRMSTSVWPAIYPAMQKYRFAANAIQNSMRELNCLNNLLAGNPSAMNYLFSFGAIEEGHTGSTFEGLWLSGVIEALKSDTKPRYGADADHIQVKRGTAGLERAQNVIQAARYYTFYTMDVSDILNYQAMLPTAPPPKTDYPADCIPDAAMRREIIRYHTGQGDIAGISYAPGEALLSKLIGKYWHALNAMERLSEYLDKLKQGIPYDLEFSIDENPPEVKTCQCITGEAELIFVILESRRRHIPITHVAPNFGIEKGVDYRCPDGLSGLEKRIERMQRIALESGLMLDFHSGDDLSSQTRKVIGRATRGHNHFKISPMLQALFADVLYEVQPDAFCSWWQATRRYVEQKARDGSEFATECLRETEGTGHAPSPQDRLFHYYHFAAVGIRDAQGQFLNRELFYTLSPAFYDRYRQAAENLLGEVAEDVLSPNR